MSAHACRDVAHLERNGATAMAASVLNSFALTGDQIAALLAGRSSAYRYARHADYWEVGTPARLVVRSTMTSLHKLGLVEPVPECCVDRRLTPDGEAAARILGRRAKRRNRR